MNKQEKDKGSFIALSAQLPIQQGFPETEIPTPLFKLPEIIFNPEEISEDMRLVHKFFLSRYSVILQGTRI